LEVQQSSENEINSTVNLISDSEERFSITSPIEPSVTQKLPTDETVNQDLSSGALMMENEDIASLLLKEVKVIERDTTRMSVVLSLNSYVSFLGLPFQNSKGQKRLFEDSLDPTEGQNSMDTSNDIFYNGFLKLKKQCIDMEDRIMKLEKDSMRR